MKYSVSVEGLELEKALNIYINYLMFHKQTTCEMKALQI